MRKSRSFKKELIYSFLTITLFSILCLGVFQIFQISSLIKENQKSQTQTTKFLEDYIINYVQDHQKAIQTQALNVKQLFANRDIAGIQQQLKDIKNNYPGFVNLYVGNKEGQSIVFYPEVYTDGAKRENLDFSDRPYYKELVEKKDTVISSVFHGRGGTDILLVTIVSPILNDNGDMEGYVLGALDLNSLDEHIKNRSFGEEGYAVVLDQENNVIVHPDIDTRVEMVNLSDSEIVRYIKEQQNEKRGHYFTVENEHEKEYITYEKIDFLDWTVWVGKPTAAITNTYKKAIMTILVFLLITAIVMIGMSLILTNRLEKTISNLLKYIKDYTKGLKKKDTITKKIHGPKEMEELFYYFNHMIHEVERNRQELIELNTALEGRVQERTARLENKNLELKAVNKLITSVSSDKDIAHFIQHCLKKIEPYAFYSIHVLFHHVAVTSTTIHTNQNLQEYLSNNMLGEQQHIEPIHVEKNHKGFLVVDLQNEQSITESDRDFLQTFASSLAVVLQNKFLFEQIRNKHAELEAVVESLSEGLMMLNDRNEVEYVNEYFLNVVTNDIAEDQPLVVLEDVYERFLTLFNVSNECLSAFFTNNQNELKLEYKQTLGKPKFYLLHKFSVMLDEERIGEGLLLRDITKEEEIDTLKNNLISLTSHEFKTPITNIKGSVETLLRSEVKWEPEFQQELLEGVHEDIERIQHLVNDWMDISKIESGTMYVERNMVRPDHIIEETIEQVPKDLRKNAIFQFHHHLDESTLFYADKRRVQQVLMNLFTNALRYNDSNLKEIDITLDKEKDHIIISVSDNGIGISKDHITRIFNRFYQVDVTATRRTGGTGLGLAICKGIMDAHEGKIEVNSEPGKGSTFILSFPLRKEVQHEKSKDLYCR